MRILTAEQFQKEPYGVVYMVLDSRYEFCIKHSTRCFEEFGNSWWAMYLVPTFEEDEAGQSPFWNENVIGKDVEMKIMITDDATYNHDDDTLYGVFTTDEVQAIITNLQSSLQISGSWEPDEDK